MFFFQFGLNVFVSTQLKWLNFLGQNDSIFLSVRREKKLSHFEIFDLKSRVTGGTKIRPNFLGQNDSILTWKVESLAELKFDPTFRSKWLNFSRNAPREIIESFWPKKLSHWN